MRGGLTACLARAASPRRRSAPGLPACCAHPCSTHAAPALLLPQRQQGADDPGKVIRVMITPAKRGCAVPAAALPCQTHPRLCPDQALYSPLTRRPGLGTWACWLAPAGGRPTIQYFFGACADASRQRVRQPESSFAGNMNSGAAGGCPGGCSWRGGVLALPLFCRPQRSSMPSKAAAVLPGSRRSPPRGTSPSASPTPPARLPKLNQRWSPRRQRRSTQPEDCPSVAGRSWMLLPPAHASCTRVLACSSGSPGALARALAAHPGPPGSPKNDPRCLARWRRGHPAQHTEWHSAAQRSEAQRSSKEGHGLGVSHRRAGQAPTGRRSGGDGR